MAGCDKVWQGGPGYNRVWQGVAGCQGATGYGRVCQDEAMGMAGCGYGVVCSRVQRGEAGCGYDRVCSRLYGRVALCINKAKRPTCVKRRHAARYSAYPQPQSISSNAAGISTTAATTITCIATAAAGYTDEIRLPVAETIGRRRIRQWQTFRALGRVQLWRGIL